MASPNHAQPSTSAHPITPPAESSTATSTQQTTAPNPNPNPTTTTAAANNTNPSAPANAPTQIPSTSLKDSGKTRRPRDVRLIHMLLSSLGVTAYQERIPLQLLDFAYRYTSSVLQDAVHLATEGYAGSTDGGPGSSRAPAEVNSVSLPALRLSIASRLHYQFQPGLPKEFLMDVAAERNRVALPGASRGFDTQGAVKAPAANQSVIMGGMRLPPERFCLTGTGWGLRDEWESEGEEEEEVAGEGDAEGRENGVVAKEEDGEGEGDEDEDGKMEDVFGEDTAMGEGEGGRDGDGDRDMEDV
ncbi:TFIID-31kDa-domain-containing protein [Aspergillus ellipticus CBS 707.79]|uniref:TFIID-31kDa-domain-containing protein n=1 Tax=Aspergillus ellipticus CBS 707.79 TaxID=1448320 RepID=A0A319DPG0_9EURO|nr:TFIID-31kDa-domain-containing protein [Aspergillus ellipticus CBS 707.79]